MAPLSFRAMRESGIFELSQADYYLPRYTDMKDKQLSFTEAVVAMITIPLALVIGSILLSKKKR